MLRSAFHYTTIALTAAAFVLLIILFGFFASPNAVRISPPSPNSTLLFDQLQQQ